MGFRSFPFAAAFLCLVMGCAAQAEPQDDVDTTEAALRSTSLRSLTALDRVRTLEGEAGTVAVDYVPTTDPYSTQRHVAFEAVAFDAANATSEIAVSGDFPSSALVIVTNERFEPLAASRTVRRSSGVAEASVRVPAGDGQRLVLVRDPKWVKPMTFDVRVAPLMR